MKDRNTWFPSVGAIGVAAFGLALFGDADLASSQELKRIESAALERFAMHSNFEEGGMWTHYVPKDLNGEFDSYDPIGLIAGSLIKTDCSIHWQNDEGLTYCFASNASLVHFQEWPQTNVKKATKAWHELADARGRPQS